MLGLRLAHGGSKRLAGTEERERSVEHRGRDRIVSGFEHYGLLAALQRGAKDGQLVFLACGVAGELSEHVRRAAAWRRRLDGLVRLGVASVAEVGRAPGNHEESL